MSCQEKGYKKAKMVRTTHTRIHGKKERTRTYYSIPKHPITNFAIGG
jgi:hypothetical protein